MDSQVWWWFMIIWIVISLSSIEAHRLIHFLDEKNESTNQKQTSTTSASSSYDYFNEFQSISTINLATITSTIRSNSTIQSFITKSNSYLYFPHEDKEISFDRTKRETAPFVCKSKNGKLISFDRCSVCFF